MVEKLLRTAADLFGKLERGLRRTAESHHSTEPYILKYEPKDRPVTIVHVNGNFIVGGNTQLIVDIIERTSDKYSHEVVVPSHPRPLPYQPVKIREFSVRQLIELYDYLKERQPALVHINYWVKQEDRFAECAIWFQTIFKICEELNFKVIQNVTIPAEPFISPVVQHNVFVSRFVADNFNIDPKTPSSVIYPGSDFTHFNNCDIETLPGKAIGMVYRLDRDKLNAEAIEVFISAVKKDRTIISYIVGGGYYLEQYKKRVRQEGLEKNFVFTGFVSYKQLPAHYRKMSVFVTPVHDESFGQVTPFAMSMGLSVAGYKVGALPEILGSTETLVEQGDIESLSQLIVDLTNDAERRLRLGRENQSRAVRYFSMETMIKEYSALYEMLTTGRPG